MRVIAVALVLLAVAAGLGRAQEAGEARPASATPSAAVRNAILALQQQGAAMEILIAYYNGRIEQMKSLCGDPCKDK